MHGMHSMPVAPPGGLPLTPRPAPLPLPLSGCSPATQPPPAGTSSGGLLPPGLPLGCVSTDDPRAPGCGGQTATTSVCPLRSPPRFFPCAAASHMRLGTLLAAVSVLSFRTSAAGAVPGWLTAPACLTPPTPPDHTQPLEHPSPLPCPSLVLQRIHTTTAGKLRPLVPPEPLCTTAWTVPAEFAAACHRLSRRNAASPRDGSPLSKPPCACAPLITQLPLPPLPSCACSEGGVAATVDNW